MPDFVSVLDFGRQESHQTAALGALVAGKKFTHFHIKLTFKLSNSCSRSIKGSGSSSLKRRRNKQTSKNATAPNRAIKLTVLLHDIKYYEFVMVRFSADWTH